MNPRSIQSLILVRSVEEADKQGAALPFSLREHASQQALASANPGASTDAGSPGASQWRFLAARADLLRDPASAVVGGEVGLPFGTWRIGAGLCVIAFATGLASHAAGLSRAFDLLAGPLLAVFLWNAVVYVFMLHRLLRPSGNHEGHGLIARWLGGKIRALDGGHAAHAARQRYLEATASWHGSWAGSWVASWFHAGSACFAMGLLTALYFRGLYTGYLAGWESTWLDADAIGFIVGHLLGPASWVSGIPLPETTGEWGALERLPGTAGVKAAPWIHLYAITTLGWVVVPRCLLCLMSHLRAKRARATPPAWNAGDSYLRRLLGLARQDGDFSIAILPFDIKKPDVLRQGACRDAFERLAREAWGQGARPCWLECAPYGSEDGVWDTLWADAACDGALLLFDMTSTPEDEVHGLMIDEVVRRFGESRGGVMIAIEASRLAADRYPARLALWREIARKKNLSILPVDSGIPREPDLVPSALVHHSA